MTMNGEPIAYCYNLYETFDDVCDALEEERKIRVDYDEKIKPNREEKLKEIQDWHNVLYYSAPNGDRFIIVKMNVIPKKPTTPCTKCCSSWKWVQNEEFGSYSAKLVPEVCRCMKKVTPADRMTKRQEFKEKWNQMPRDKLALAIQEDCRTIITKIEAGPYEEDHPAHLKNAKYVLHCCRSDAVEELGEGELHPDWNEVHDWTLHFFMNDFFMEEDTFQFPITKKVWLEL
jgi:hypothetical protein